MSVSALYVIRDGPYYGLGGVDPWDEARDARLYAGPHPVVAHPPCARWGRYWGGGPMLAGTPGQKLLGDDGGCFAAALWAVRIFGGVLEHPEASHAWRWFGLRPPPRSGGWWIADDFGGWTCCVEQGHYGHRARKATWLYGNGSGLWPELRWGPSTGTRIDPGFHSAAERAEATDEQRGVERLSAAQRMETPAEFRDVLISIARETGRDHALGTRAQAHPAR